MLHAGRLEKSAEESRTIKPSHQCFQVFFQATVISIEQHFAAPLCFFPSPLIVWHMHTLMGFLLLGGIPSRRVLQLKGQDAICFRRVEVQARIPLLSWSSDLQPLLPGAGRLDPIVQFPGRKRWKYSGGAATDHKPSPANKADLPYKRLYVTQVISQ